MAVSVSLARGVGGWVGGSAGSAGILLDLTKAELSSADRDRGVCADDALIAIDRSLNKN